MTNASHQHQGGDLARHKLSGEEVLILSLLESDDIGQLYLIRFRNHKKLQVYGCELDVGESILKSRSIQS